MSESTTISFTYEDAPGVTTPPAEEPPVQMPPGGEIPPQEFPPSGGPALPGDPTISTISPMISADYSTLSVSIAGTNFRDGGTATLSKSTTINSTGNTVASSTSFSCSFDISAYEPGDWTFRFTNIDGTSATHGISMPQKPTSGSTGGTGGNGGTGGTTGGDSGGGAGGYEWKHETPTSPPPNWTPSEGCAIAAEDVELTDGFIIPKGSTICNDGSVLLTDGTWLPAGTATASHIKGGQAAAGGGVNLWVVGAILAGLGAIGYMYSKRGGE